MRIAVVGAGVVGLSAALACADRGHRVRVHERFGPGHTFGSSHGRSRIVRRAYPDARYTAAMGEAFPLWRDLEARTSQTLLRETGLVYFGDADSPDLRRMVEGLAALDVPHDVLEPEAIPRISPLRLNRGEVGVWTPEAGWVDANQTCRLLRELCVDQGVEFRWHDKADRTVPGDCVLVAAGSWVGDWAPVPAFATLQTYGYVRGQLAGPVWIQDSPALEYGFPTEPGADAFKIGIHRHGPTIRPDDPRPGPDPVDLEAVRTVAASRFGVQNPTIAEAGTCVYTNLANDEFAFGAWERGFYASACSGHGFKFGPWSGRTLADLAEGRRRVEDLPVGWGHPR